MKLFAVGVLLSSLCCAVAATATANSNTSLLAESIRLLSRSHPNSLNNPAAVKHAALAISSAHGMDASREFVSHALVHTVESLELAKQLQQGPAAVDAVLAQRLGFKLVQTSASGSHIAWMTEAEKLQLRQLGIKFADITAEAVSAAKGEVNLSLLPLIKPAPLPAELSRGDKVEAVSAHLNADLMKSVLPQLASFHNRYYMSDLGRQSSAWLHEQILDTIESSGRTDASAYTFKHAFPQTSTVAVIPGSSLANETVVISAHQDSINLWLPWFAPAPGAYDDGSGTVAILEAFRALLVSGFKPERSIEFHWYAAEEGGLLGAKDIANDYKKSGRIVHANLQFDEVGHPGHNGNVGIISDFIDPELTALLSQIFTTYTKVKPIEFACGYACSDHAAWFAAGFRASFTTDSLLTIDSSHIHTVRDTLDKVDYNHLLDFSKVAVAFAIELSL